MECRANRAGKKQNARLVSHHRLQLGKEKKNGPPKAPAINCWVGFFFFPLKKKKKKSHTLL
jgi:hypothetical protein